MLHATRRTVTHQKHSGTAHPPPTSNRVIMAGFVPFSNNKSSIPLNHTLETADRHNESNEGRQLTDRARPRLIALSSSPRLYPSIVFLLPLPLLFSSLPFPPLFLSPSPLPPFCFPGVLSYLLFRDVPCVEAQVMVDDFLFAAAVRCLSLLAPGFLFQY